jgi:ferredoxin
MLFLTAVGAISGLTFILATALVLANRKLYVYEDPRIDGKCTVSSQEDREDIAHFLGVDVGAEEKLVARLACAGGTNVARNHARYHGHQTCRSAARVAGGGKGCFWGCLGLGDCDVACDFDAIHMTAHNLPVVDEAKCTACGDCVEVCPKDLFSLHKESHRLWVVCSSQEAGDEILEDCEVACTTCGRCEMDAPGGLISMKKNLPVVDYSRQHKTRAPIERCPTGAIVWIDPKAGPVKGSEAKKIIRKGTLRDAPT